MAKFNGHKNWNHWNVSLWINNDEGLYNAARQYAIDFKGNRNNAAWELFSELKRSGITRTPDGAPYSKTTILAAMRGIV